MSSTRTPKVLLAVVQNAFDARIGGKEKVVSDEMFASILEEEQKNPDIQSAILTIAFLALKAKTESEKNQAHRTFAVLVAKTTKKDKEFLRYLASQIRDDYPVARAICLAQRRKLQLIDEVEDEQWPTARILLSTHQLNAIFEG